MKIVVLHEHLSKQLTIAGKFIPSKSITIPSLQNFYIEAREGKISLFASNVETTIRAEIPGKIEEEGQLLLPSKTILSLLPTLIGEKITLETKEKTLLISSQKTKVELVVEKTEDYPKQEMIEKKEQGSLSDKLIQEIKTLVAFASSNDQARPILTSLLIQGDGKQIRSAATDGFRLAFQTIGEVVFEGTIVISSSVFSVIAGLLKEEKQEKIGVVFEERFLQFQLPQLLLKTQIIEGTFPDYGKIIPKEHSTRIRVSVDELLQAVRFASVLAREASNIIRFNIKAKKMTVSANAPQTGKNSMELSVEQEGEDVDVAFNYRFIQEFLSVGLGSDVVFETNGALAPGVFRWADKEGYLYIVMPVRLQES